MFPSVDPLSERLMNNQISIFNIENIIYLYAYMFDFVFFLIVFPLKNMKDIPEFSFERYYIFRRYIF